MKNTKVNIIIGIIISIIGVVFLFSSISSILANDKFRKENIKIMATVTDSNANNNFTAVSFYIDKKEYNAIAQKYYSDIKTGDKIEIYYNKENPSQILLEDNNRGAGVYFAISIVLLAVGLGMIIHKLNNSVNKEAIIKSGKVIQADIENIICDTKVTINGKHPYRVICVWENKGNGKIYKFESDNLWYNPKEQLKKAGIDKIPVHIIPSNPRQYFVDMELVNKSTIPPKEK